MNRRKFISGVGVLGGTTIAGCGEADDTSEPEPRPEPEPKPEPKGKGELEPAEFRFVEINPGDVTVEYGEEVDIEVVLENIGEKRDTKEVKSRIDGEVIDTAEYTLEGGEETRVSAEVQTIQRTERSYNYSFSTEDGEISSTLTVELNQPNPIQLSGNGSRVSDSFDIEGGMVVTEWEHSGEGNFIIDLVDPSGSQRDESVADEIGSVEGVWGQGVPEGEYILDIEADCDWNIEIHQPRVTLQDGEKLPYSTRGSSDGWFIINTEGAARVSASHSGGANFIVSSYEITGNRHSDTVVFDETRLGQYNGDTTFSYDYATLFIVEADGSWELEFNEL